MSLKMSITARSAQSGARVGEVTTPHGVFRTPAFMPVGTRGTVKGILPAMIRDKAEGPTGIGADVVLANTYHLLLRPGPERVERLGGLHAFMCWDGPILTDSGGYQAYSMADINAIDEDGVRFRSFLDGREIHLTPESSMDTQARLGADIIMAFDDCPPSVDPDAGPSNQTRLRLAALRDTAKGRRYDHDARLDAANERTARWLQRCSDEHRRLAEAGEGFAHRQALFGIVQGGTDLDRRDRSVELVCNVDLPGYAIGGVAVGETSEDIARVVDHTAGRLPDDKPRYLMGVGYERDIVAAVLAGVDMFDCVLPTRNGRSANAFTRDGQIRLKNARFAEDAGPLEAGCDCPACEPGRWGWSGAGDSVFSRAYIRHLFLAGEMLGPILVSLHNLRHYERLMLDIRRVIPEDDWLGLWRRWPVARPALERAGLVKGDGSAAGRSPGESERR